jgi:hypothetical protein
MIKLVFDTAKLERELKRFQADIEKEVAKAIKDTVLFAYTEIKANAPIETGYLKSSVSYKADATSGSVDVGADYAIYVENSDGSPRVSGTIPFIEPAIEKAEAMLLQKIKSIKV